MAAVYGTRHEDLTVDPDIIPTIAATVQATGEPFADSSAIPTFLLSEMTRRRVTVALSGDGGDEAFAGYIRHRLAIHRRPTRTTASSWPVRLQARSGASRVTAA